LTAGAALLHRQAGLGTVESLDLAFFIDAQDQRFVRGMEIEPDDVLDFGGEVFVARDLERLNEMWLQPMRSPDPLDATQGGAGGCRHAAAAPVGRIGRLRVQSQVRHALDQLGRQRFYPRRTGRVLQESLDPFGRIALAPPTHRQQALGYRRRDRLCRHPFACRKHDLRSPNNFLRRIPVSDQPLQSLTIGGADPNLFDFPHQHRFAGLNRFVNHPSASEH
jgi:hypothetical protein